MAGKSAIPLLLGAGAIALAMGVKKKKSSNGTNAAPEEKDPEENGSRKPFIEPADWKPSGGSDNRMIFSEECNSIANKVDLTPGGAYDSWITNRYYQLLDQQMNVGEITRQLMVDQGEHCPWDDPDKYTPLMQKAYEDTLDAVKQFHASTGGKNPW